LGINKQNGERVAVKVVQKDTLTPRQLDRVYNELEILQICQHPNIVHMDHYFETPENIFIILELATGGELFDRIIAVSYFSEEEACVILKQIGSAIQYLHNKGIVHRDLKPENMLYKNKNSNSTLCIADFGFSKFVNEGERLSTPCGTLGYAAPEIANAQTYSKGVDLWSLGVTMYTLLCGFPPFYADDEGVLFQLISEGIYSFPDPWWSPVSNSAKDLISHLLDKNVATRYSIEEFLAHPWMQGKYKQTKNGSPGDRKNKEGTKKSVDSSRESMVRAVSEGSLWMQSHKKKH